MKAVTVIFLCLTFICAKAQNVQLQTGKKINSTVTATMNMDMGIAGGAAKIETTTNSVINVTGTDNNFYKANQTVTRIKMSQEGAGQGMSYDSDDKADSSSEIAKAMGASVNRPAAVLIDKKDGSVKDASPEKPDETMDNPLTAMMGGTQSAAAAAGTAFLVIPAGKKVGDTWVDSSGDKEMSAVKNYLLQSVQNGIATVKLKTVSKAQMDKEAQGAQFTITMNGTAESIITTDTKTGLVQKNTTTANMDGNLEMMGQSMPLTMSINSSAVFE